YKVPVNGGTVVTFATGQYGAFHLAVDSTHVYWTTDGFSCPLDAGGCVSALRRLPFAGGSAPETVVSGDASGAPLVVSGSYVYWLASGATIAGGSLRKAPITGGAPITLASNLNDPRDLAISGNYVYVTLFGDGM